MFILVPRVYANMRRVQICVYGGNSASSDGLLTVGTLDATEAPINDGGIAPLSHKSLLVCQFS
jgi:hypothetical protein